MKRFRHASKRFPKKIRSPRIEKKGDKTMTAILARISLQAEKLPKKERLILAEHLLESADEISSTEWDRLWIAEIKRRYKRFLSGKTKSRSSEDVFRDIRKRFKK